ncbi:hypothetical protein I3843_15G149200 [Carya illinoinensis]|nr:hypothetical protein I3843_15G149200 [Carya illinoinensis]
MFHKLCLLSSIYFFFMKLHGNVCRWPATLVCRHASLFSHTYDLEPHAEAKKQNYWGLFVVYPVGMIPSVSHTPNTPHTTSLTI